MYRYQATSAKKKIKWCLHNSDRDVYSNYNNIIMHACTIIHIKSIAMKYNYVDHSLLILGI